MKQLIDRLNLLRRPRLLIQAARIGAATYRRDLHLRRLLEPGQLPRSPAALALLMEMEAAVNAERKAGDGTYCAADHVDLLIALMGEARLVRAIHDSARADAPTPLRQWS